MGRVFNLGITLPLHKEAEEILREAWGEGIDQAALEALVIEAYRTGRLGLSRVRRLLGLETRWDVERWLGQRGVNWNSSLDDLEDDQRTLDRVLGADR